ncbi:MAG TPA: carbon-nitrogen hydrolase family protein [Planctomycetota bacterium]|nr:carbon-nitrogen hydrolase family protein [Planctomycetota bacterium]
MEDFILAVGQWPVARDRERNLDRAEAFLRAASAKGASLCLLPEMFQTPYELGLLKSRAEDAGGATIERMRGLARELRLHVVAGSIPESHRGQCHNSAFVLGADGEILGVHRKIHLFDVSLPDVNVKESAVLAPGDRPLVLDLAFCRLGVAICYDTRFPEVFHLFEEEGVEVAAIPAAFSRTTGRAHWHLLMRSRAVDYQVYLAAACPAPDEASSYIAYGHSLVIDPWGTVLAEAGEGEEWIFASVSAGALERVRRELPLLQHRRPDLYDVWRGT